MNARRLPAGAALALTGWALMTLGMVLGLARSGAEARGA